MEKPPSQPDLEVMADTKPEAAAEAPSEAPAAAVSPVASWLRSAATRGAIHDSSSCFLQAPVVPIFGSNASFGGTGFGGFAGVVKAEASGDGAEAEEEEAGEEECKAEFKPVVQLEEVDVSTGEEDEQALFDA